MEPKLGTEGGEGFKQQGGRRKKISNGFRVGEEFRKLHRVWRGWIKALTVMYSK